MISFLLCRAGNHTVRNSYLYEFPGVRNRVVAMNYEGVMRARELPYGCYVFTDLERASPLQIEGINLFHDHLATLVPRVRILNDPLQTMGRYDLLHTLYERGINDFDVYRATEDRRPRRYPVFLRREDDHEGPISVLIADATKLRRVLQRAEAAGHPRDRLLIVEFCDTRSPDGLYRKYGAFYVDGTVIPRHLVISRNWIAKFTDFKAIAGVLPLAAQIEEEARYVDENPHGDQVRAVFELARIEYGRIDYAVAPGGSMRVWEINTNPVIAESRNIDGSERHRRVLEPGVRRLAEAIVRLDAGLPSAGKFPLDPPIAERLPQAAA